MKKINHIDSIRSPIITEKATILSEQNKSVFKVHSKANKKTIKKNIEKLFKVNVIKVNIINSKTKFKIKQGKKSYKSGYKKAIITEKATILSEQNKTVFRVHNNANKKTIKKNIEKLFKVNIINQKSKLKMKQGRKSYKTGYKKAIVTLKKGQSIDLTTGI